MSGVTTNFYCCGRAKALINLTRHSLVTVACITTAIEKVV